MVLYDKGICFKFKYVTLYPDTNNNIKPMIKIINHIHTIFSGTKLKLIRSIFIVAITTAAPLANYAQQWSDPINISNSTDVDAFPDICVDTNSVLHCVWAKKVDNSTCIIYYRKSTNHGETWSYPIKLSIGNSGWAHLPKIVCDNNNILYVIYKYDSNNPAGENLWFTKHTGQYWTSPVTIADGYPGLFPEDLAVDNNNRVYVFWRYFDHKFHYRYYENNTWSDVFCPFGHLSDIYYINVIKAKSDIDNNLHCIGRYRESEQDTSKTSYFFYDHYEDAWSEPDVVGIYLSDVTQDISLDTNGNPHMVWRGVFEYPDSPDATFYKLKTGNQWAETELIVEDPWAQKIDIINDNVFLADVEKEGNDKKVVFYKKDWFNQWEGQVVIVNHFIGIHSLFHDQVYLYILLYGKIDDEDILDVYIIRTPIDSLITSVNKIKSLNTSAILLSQNYPNPFSSATKIDFELNSSGKTKLLIMDIKGIIVKQYNFDIIGIGKYEIIWDGTGNNGNKLVQGIYYYRLIVDDRQKTKSMILTN